MALLDDILARDGKTRADINPRSRLGQAVFTDGVPDSPEVQRVLALPRKDALDHSFIDELSAALRIDPTARLRPRQAEALCAMASGNGVFAPLGVGVGKTLLSFLLPVACGAVRPVLMIPASLREKTARDATALRRQWKIANNIDVLSYEMLGHPKHENDLLDLAPDLLICDEAHALRNPSAAVTRRVKRYVEERRPRVVLMSGTLMQSRVEDLHHLLMWTHGPERAPIPKTKREAQVWGRAIDESSFTSLGPGALAPLGESQPELRAGYGRHVSNTFGVVASTTVDCPASIRLVIEKCSLSSELTQAIATLRATGCRPDGVELEDAQLAACELQLSCGFWYGWKHMPPEPWSVARRNWHRLVREVLAAQLPGLDSPLQVWNNYGHTTPEGRTWGAIRHSFRPEQVTNWVDRSVVAGLLESCRKPTIVWTSHVAVGRLAEELGYEYYGKNKRTSSGKHIMDASPLSTIVCSIDSCLEGTHMIGWSHNLVLTPPAEDLIWEQMIGRTHREGQKADEVEVRVWAPTQRARDRVLSARTDAEARQQLCQQPQRLVLADLE